MGKAAKRRFKPADDYRYIAVDLSYFIAIDYDGSVGSKADLAAGAVSVRRAALLGDGIVSDHRVDIAAADKEAEPWSAEAGEILIAAPIGLSKECDFETRILKHPRDYGRAEAGVVDISVAADIDKIRLLPSPLEHIFFCYG